jgi:hypothetical protein
MQLISGPLRTMTAITQKNLVESQLLTNARLVVIHAGIQANNGDADSDSFIEPVEYVPNGTGDCNITLIGGGCLPLTLGASLRDPFGRAYGYCVWDHGAVDNGHADSAVASPYRLNGDTDPTHPVIALISGGRDQTFQTSCLAYDGAGTDGVARVVGSDDLVFTYTYAEASAASGGLWSIKPTDADTAEIAKDLEVKDSSNNVTVAIDRATGIGDFLGITTDVITAKTGNDLFIEGLTEIEIPTDDGDILSLRNQDAPLFVFNSAYNSNHRLPIFEMRGTNDIGGTRGVAGIIQGDTASTQWQATDAILQFNAKRGGGASTVGNLFNWMSNDSPVMTLSHEGNLGIGTNSPTERLSVYKPSTEMIDSTGSVVKITTNSMDNLGATADPTLLEVVGTFGGVPKGRLFEARNSTHTLSLRNDHTSFMRINRGTYTDAVTRAGGIAYPLLGLSYNDNLFDGYTPLLGQSIDLNVTSWGGSTSSYRDIYGTATKIRGAAPGVGGDFFGLYLDVDGGDKNYSVFAASGDAYFANSVGIGTTNPQTTLDVAGTFQASEIKLGAAVSLTCDASIEGMIRYNSTKKCVEVCDATAWTCPVASACGDETADAFVFTDLANQAENTLVLSNIVQINGIACAVSAQVGGDGSPNLRVCSDSGCSTILQDWTTFATVEDGNYVQLRMTTAAAGGAVHAASFYVGANYDHWTTTSSFSDCSGAVSVGTVCADGTIYAGTSPDGNVPMYATRCDSNQYWNGASCLDCASGHWTGTGSTCTNTYGSGTDLAWASGETVDVPLPSDQNTNGDGNTQILESYSSADAPYQAAKYCGELIANGRSDWYLPSISELGVLRENVGAIENFNGGGRYWSSTESAPAQQFASATNPNTGSSSSESKTTTNPVRCVRQ